MPRIDPLSLLKCLSVLLGPTGGIKSKEEVIRLANLMTKFSKKLVSKCIYIQILKSTDAELLNQFMGAGGWNLIHMWLTDGILSKNWALIQELLELLLLCPVDIERLKSNNCPKLIKGLSKEGSHQGVRLLASRLVEQWLKMVKGEVPSNSVAQAVTPNNAAHPLQHNAIDTTTCTSQPEENVEMAAVPQSPVKQHLLSNSQSNNVQIKTEPQEINTTVLPSPVYKLTIRDGKKILTQVQADLSHVNLGEIRNSELSKEVTDKPLKVEDSEELHVNTLQTENIDKTSSNIVQENLTSCKNIDEIDSTVSKKEKKDDIDLHKESIKTVSDKENRDKKDEKKNNVVSEKKSSSSSSKGSSKHASKHSSSKHSSTSHRTSSKSSSSSRDKSSSKDKHSSSSSKQSSSSSKSKSDRDKDKEKVKKDQAEKDKATLEKVQTQSIFAKMGKIPKKKSEDEKTAESPVRKGSIDSKENKEKVDPKKTNTSPATDKKNAIITNENKKNSELIGTRPKTVKTFNSKFRSTGLEEEVKPPAPRGAKKPITVDKKALPIKALPLKRPSPAKDTGPGNEKKIKLSLDTVPTEEKKGGIKLIPPKPKPMVLQESDMFMDALCASSKKEPRKRKRKNSKDALSTDSKKPADNNHANSTPPTSPSQEKDFEDRPLSTLKPNLKFYQDTLESSDEKAKLEDGKKDGENESEDQNKNQTESKNEDDEEGSRTPTPENDFEESRNSDSEDPAAAVSEAISKEVENGTFEPRPITSVLKSVLVLQKRKGPKKSIKWKTELESVRYFELDETERVNVTKTFTDMRLMEKQNEREAFQMARKLCNEDLMEEKTRWRLLIPIDLPPPLAEPGKDSREKDIQYAREKGILQALYFNRSMIPESPAEPDEERHLIYQEPKMIPLDDLTGNKDVEKDFTSMPWPQPKAELPSPSTIAPNAYFQTFRPNQMNPQIPPPNIMTQIPQNILNPLQAMTADLSGTVPQNTGAVTGGGWRTGDGKLVVPEPNPYPQPMETDSMASGGMIGQQPMYNQEGFMINSNDMNYNYNQGPPGMFNGPPPPGHNFQGPRGPMHGNRGRGGPPGWFRGGPRGMPMNRGRGGWRGSGKQPPVCRQFSKNGFCRVGDKCQYLHPAPNY